MKEIDFREVKNASSKDQLKMQILQHELTVSSMHFDFTTLMQAIFDDVEDGKMKVSMHTEEGISLFCRILKLPIPCMVAIGLAMGRSDNATWAMEGLKFLKYAVTELISTNSILNSELLHAVVVFLYAKAEFLEDAKFVTEIMGKLKNSHENVKLATEVVCLFNDTNKRGPMNVIKEDCLGVDNVDRIVNDMEICPFYELMEQVGWQVTTKEQTFELFLKQVHHDEWTNHDVAGMMRMIATSKGEAGKENNLQLMFPLEDWDSIHEEYAQEWNTKVMKKVIFNHLKQVEWHNVLELLDHPSMMVQSKKQLDSLFAAFAEWSGKPFPIQTLFSKVWTNTKAQLSILSILSTYTLPTAEQGNQSTLAPQPMRSVWFEVDFVDCLLKLADTNERTGVCAIFEQAKQKQIEILLVCLVNASQKVAWNDVRMDYYVDAFYTYFFKSSNNTAITIPYLWDKDIHLTLHALVVSWTNDEDLAIRIYDILHSIKGAFQQAVQVKRFRFALTMAIVGFNANQFDMEEWLHAMEYDPDFASKVVIYMRIHYQSAIQKSSMSSPNATLSVEALAILLKGVTTWSSLLPHTLMLELKEIYGICLEEYPTLKPLLAQAEKVEEKEMSDVISNTNMKMSEEEIEEKANYYFQRIYTSEQSLDEVIEMLKRFKNSSNSMEKSIFICMIHNLFDEYRFFHKYPDMELRITGVLFGRLIQHQLVTNLTLRLALNCVIESLETPTDTKLFRFGMFALEQFVPRLPEMPEYCLTLNRITTLRQLQPEVCKIIDSTIEGFGPPENANPGIPSSMHIETNSVSSSAVLNATPALAELKITEKVSLLHLGMASSSGGDAERGKLSSEVNVPPQSINVDHVFGPLSCEDLQSGNDEEYESPSEIVQGKYHFIINNVSIQNLKSKLMEMREIIVTKHFKWLSNYLVTQRLCSQPNYHDVYRLILDQLGFKDLEDQVLRRTMQQVRGLLESKTITTNSQERSLLKNLGAWLGAFTLGRNKPLLQREVDLKELLYVGYETGHLIAVTAFIAKILDAAVKSTKIFKPPNPWIMGLLHAMREIYDVPDLKLNIKFEIEVLCKALNIKLVDIRKSDALKERKPPPRHSNPDFNVSKESKTTVSSPLQAASLVDANHGKSQNEPSVSIKTNKPIKSELPPAFQEATVIPNLAAYVSINPNIKLFQDFPSLKCGVPVAVDRAIREIIQPVVERSVTIACITSRELIVKDFAIEGDEVKMRKAAHLMVSNLAGSLALVTCKEPLRVSIGNHLRSLLNSALVAPGPSYLTSQFEKVMQVCSAENLELGCMLIEKAATEKAMRDIDESLGAAYSSRKRFRDSGNAAQPFFDATVVNASKRFFRALPEQFRPKLGGLDAAQLQVYEAYQRQPRQPIVPSARASATPSTAAVGNMKPEEPIASHSQPPTALVEGIEMMKHILQVLEKDVFAARKTLEKGASFRLSSLPSDSEAVAKFREFKSFLTSEPITSLPNRDEVISVLGQRVFQRMYEVGNVGDETQLEMLFALLEAIVHCCSSLKKEVISWVSRTNAEDKIKLHYEIMVNLIRQQLVEFPDVDNYLSNLVEKRSTMPNLMFVAHIVHACCQVKTIVAFSSLRNTIRSLEAYLTVHGAQNAQGISSVIEFARAQYKEYQEKGAANNVPSFVPSSISMPVKYANDKNLHRSVASSLESWIQLCQVSPPYENSCVQFVNMLSRMLTDEEKMLSFFIVSFDMCVEACSRTGAQNGGAAGNVALRNGILDAFSKMVAVLLKYSSSPPNVKVILLNKALQSIVFILNRHYESFYNGNAAEGPKFDQRVYLRVIVSLMQEVSQVDVKVEGMQFQYLSTIGLALDQLQPLNYPGFALSWVELMSNRSFVPKLLMLKGQTGWPILQRLLLDLLNFLNPHLCQSTLAPTIRTIYKGVLRVMILLLHDCSEFLCFYAHSICDVLPSNCIQLRNLILSAFPRGMRLPAPMTPGLQVARYSEIHKAPTLSPNCLSALKQFHLQEEFTSFSTRRKSDNVVNELCRNLIAKLKTGNSKATPKDDPSSTYNVAAINSVVLYLGTLGINEIEQVNMQSSNLDATTTKDGKEVRVMNFSLLERSVAVEIFETLLNGLDSEGHYRIFSAMVNNLRYPNSHTYYFSNCLLYIFASSESDQLKERVTRVLLERLIAYRPHPWGLLFTFIELVRNPKFKFWDQTFLDCSQEIKVVFEDVARSCMGTASSNTKPTNSYSGMM